MEPPATEHGVLAVALIAHLHNHVQANNLGYVTVENGCILERDPDTVRAPDVAFFRHPDSFPKSFIIGAPDLVVEIVSPGNRLVQLARKINQFLEKGAQLGWLVNPRNATVTVFRPNRETEILGKQQYLDGEQVIPGFRYLVADLFSYLPIR